MKTAQVVETSVTVNNNSPVHDYVHPDDQTQPTFEMTPAFKPLTVYIFVVVKIFFFLRNMLVITVAMFLTKIYTNRKSAQILVHKQ